jgi:hypothetical protein
MYVCVYLWNLVMIIPLAFLGPQKQQPKDNPNGAFGLGVWTIKVANCPSLMILWAWGVPQNNGPLRTGGPRAHYFRNALAQAHLHGVKNQWIFPSIKNCFFPP